MSQDGRLKMRRSKFQRLESLRLLWVLHFPESPVRKQKRAGVKLSLSRRVLLPWPRLSGVGSWLVCVVAR